MKRIRELRKSKKISQKYLAEILNSTQQTISKYEHGLLEPDVTTLKALARYFNVSLDYLVGITDMKSYEYNQNYIKKLESKIKNIKDIIEKE